VKIDSSIPQSKKYQRSKLILNITELLIGLGFLIVVIISGFTTILEDWLGQFIQNQYGLLFLFVTFLGIMELLIQFPLTFLSGYYLEHHFQLSNQTLFKWFLEQIKGILVSTPLLLALITILYTFLYYYPRNWWFLMGSVMVLFSIVLARLAPILIFPIFYKFKPLEDEVLAQEVTRLCQQVGLNLSGVFQFNLSKTTRKANAAFTGIGKSRRVILGDNLLNGMNHDEILAVLAHELGHYKLKHIWKGMAVGTLLTYAGLYLVSLVYASVLKQFGFTNPSQIAALPLIGILLTLFQFVITPITNIYSRANEKSADDFAVRMIGSADSFISGLNKLAEQNLADCTPHPLIEFLFYSHPSIAKRIARLSNDKPNH
jgi:STE24 endopeptidase